MVVLLGERGVARGVSARGDALARQRGYSALRRPEI